MEKYYDISLDSKIEHVMYVINVPPSSVPACRFKFSFRKTELAISSVQEVADDPYNILLSLLGRERAL